MGLDVDYLAAKSAIGKINKLLSDQRHGRREKIADDIIDFAEKMKKKYGGKKPSVNYYTFRG